ncbi:MAG: glycosyltransferase family 2 protein [Acidobacteriia bacterium]|nr:glycosyltransferase family 2 protein [Terriglobia bacterium]
MTARPPSISVVLPVYRAELILPELCKRLVASLSKLTGSYEIILVDDRSPDRSWDVMLQMVEAFSSITALRLSRNFGQHYAITAGLDLANSDWTVIMDCDLQDQPEEIAVLLEKAVQGYDVVLARRIANSGRSRRRLSSRLFYWLFNVLSGYRMDPAVGSFRIMRRSVVEAYRTMRESSRLFGGMVEWLGFETAFVDVAHSARYHGRSTYNFRVMTKLAFDGIFAFSNRPLYFSIAVGVIMSVLAAGLGLGLIVHYFMHPFVGVPGWLSEFTITAFIGGLILLNLGILGVYVGRIYDQSKGRPLYVVDRIVAHRTRQGVSAGTN